MDLNELESFTSFVSKVDPKVKNLIIDLLSSGSVVYQIDSEKYRLLSDSSILKFVKGILFVLNIDVIFSPENGTVFIRNYRKEDHAEDFFSENTDGSQEDNPNDGSENYSSDEEKGTDSTGSDIKVTSSFKRQTATYSTDNKDVEDHFLIKKKALTPFKSMLLVILRKYYQNRLVHGASANRVIIDSEELRAAFIPYVKASVSEVKDNSKISGAMDEFATYHIVRKLPSEDIDRYEIFPTIRYAVSADTLLKMLKEYELLNSGKECSEDSKAQSLDPDLSDDNE